MIDVSVCIMTYNHEKYIEKCIDSILAQHVDFKYEIIVSDDASTDKTVEIIKKRYANVVRVNEHDINQGIPRNMYHMFRLAKGKYIATIAGDDYYVNSSFLQKAYDYLEAHEESASVNDWVQVVDESGKNILYTVKAKNDKITLENFLWNDPFDCNYCLLVRNIFQSSNIQWLAKASKINDEFQYPLWILMHGTVDVLPMFGHAYRRNMQGGSNYNSMYNGTETFIDRCRACNYVKNNVFDNYNFQYIKKTVGFAALREAGYHLIKKHDYSLIIKFIKKVPFREQLNVYLSLPVLLIGKGQFPEWYKKIKRSRLYLKKK